MLKSALLINTLYFLCRDSYREVQMTLVGRRRRTRENDYLEQSQFFFLILQARMSLRNTVHIYQSLCCFFFFYFTFSLCRIQPLIDKHFTFLFQIVILVMSIKNIFFNHIFTDVTQYQMKFTEKLGNFFCCDSYIHQEKHFSLLCMFMFVITFLLFYLSTFGTKQLNDIFLHFIVNR